MDSKREGRRIDPAVERQRNKLLDHLNLRLSEDECKELADFLNKHPAYEKLRELGGTFYVASENDERGLRYFLAIPGQLNLLLRGPREQRKKDRVAELHKLFGDEISHNRDSGEAQFSSKQIAKFCEMMAAPAPEAPPPPPLPSISDLAYRKSSVESPTSRTQTSSSLFPPKEDVDKKEIQQVEGSKYKKPGNKS